MADARTPCIGICSTTSLGDTVCRGCERYSFEVINWNSYAAEAKLAVLKRIEQLNCQILENKLRIFSVPNLKLGMEQLQTPYDPAQSPYCWLQNLLKKNQHDIENLEDFGVYVLPGFSQLSLQELFELIEQELLILSEAHFSRYFSVEEMSNTA